MTSCTAAKAGAMILALGVIGSGFAMLQPAPAAAATQPGFGKDKDGEKSRVAPQRGRVKAPKVGDQAPDWTAKDPAGQEHKLSEYKGKIVVMDFWATWCGPCKKAMPAMQKLHETYKDQGVVVIGMDCMEQVRSGGDPVAYMKEKNFTYPLMLDTDEAAKAYGVQAIPTIVVVGPDGVIRFMNTGSNKDVEEKIEEAIKAHLPEVNKGAAAAPGSDDKGAGATTPDNNGKKSGGSDNNKPSAKPKP